MSNEPDYKMLYESAHAWSRDANVKYAELLRAVEQQDRQIKLLQDQIDVHAKRIEALELPWT